MAALADADMKGLRDRAILLLGFAGAFRRSELVALDVTDLEFCDGGLRVHSARCVPLPLGDSTPVAPFTVARAWGLASGLPASGGDRDTRSLGMVRSPTRHRNSADNMVPARPQPPVGHNSMRAVAGRRTRLAVDMDSLHQPADRRNTQVAAVPTEAGRQPPLPCQVPDW